MTDKLAVLHCSPALAGIKTGSMSACPYTSRKELLDGIRSLSRCLVPKGLRVLPLRYSEARSLIYVLRPQALKRDFEDRLTISLLKEQGCQDINVCTAGRSAGMKLAYRKYFISTKGVHRYIVSSGNKAERSKGSLWPVDK